MPDQLKFCPPPKHFRPAGEVEYALFATQPPLFSKSKKVTGSRAEGIRYEERVQERLCRDRKDSYVASPWFRFRSVEGKKFYYCQPDGLNFDINRGVITIVEVKLQHTANAWWQTRRLYEPVVQWLFPNTIWEIAIIEVVRWYDPHTAFPEKFKMVKDLSFTGIVPGEFHLHIWNGRG